MTWLMFFGGDECTERRSLAEFGLRVLTSCTIQYMLAKQNLHPFQPVAAGEAALTPRHLHSCNDPVLCMRIYIYIYVHVYTIYYIICRSYAGLYLVALPTPTYRTYM